MYQTSPCEEPINQLHPQSRFFLISQEVVESIQTSGLMPRCPLNVTKITFKVSILMPRWFSLEESKQHTYLGMYIVSVAQYTYVVKPVEYSMFRFMLSDTFHAHSYVNERDCYACMQLGWLNLGLDTSIEKILLHTSSISLACVHIKWEPIQPLLPISQLIKSTCRSMLILGDRAAIGSSTRQILNVWPPRQVALRRSGMPACLVPDFTSLQKPNHEFNTVD